MRLLKRQLSKPQSLNKQFSFLAVIFITICLILTSLITIGIKNLLLEQQIQNAISRTESFKSELNYLYKRVTTLYEFIQFDANLENLLLNPSNELTTTYLNSIQKHFSTLSIMNSDVADISIQSKDFSYSGLYNSATLTEFQHLTTNSNSISSIGIRESSFSREEAFPYLIFSKKIHGFHKPESFGQYLGNLVISVNPSKISTSIPTDTQLDPIYFILADSNLEFYPFNCSTDITTEIMSFLNFQSNHQNFKQDMTSSLEIQDWLIINSYIPEMDYYFISAIDTSILLKQLTKTLALAFILISSIILFVATTLRLILVNILFPLNKLHQFIKHIGEGNLRNLKKPLQLEGSTEITALCAEFNAMISEITYLNKQLFTTTTKMYELELSKKQSELLHLRSQINPHFLYNTLESMRGIALENHCPAIDQMCLNMGKIFRYSIKESPQTSLFKEVDIIKSYLYLQQIRFNERFEVLYHIPALLEDLIIPKMILQPLIENAIFHGLEPKTERGLLYVGALRLEETLHIIIQDDGIGMPPETLEKLTTLLNDPATKTINHTDHIGILNTHNRIRLESGNNYGLSIESTSDIGTKITVRLPIIERGIQTCLM